MLYGEYQGLNEVKQGKIYTGKELKLFLTNNSNVELVGKDETLADENLYEVKQKIRNYFHTARNGSYCKMSFEKTLYIIE